ncbi:zf-DHHC-domain-containing protein, partial [Aureobasidium melanogenum]
LNHPATPVASGHKASSGRNYQYFNGNAVFFLHGRLINARQRPLNVFTALLAVIPAALFFGFSAPWLWHHVSPAIPILFAYVFFICISSYLHASFSEPGIIPRNLHPQPPTPADEDPLAIGPSTTEWVTVRSFGPNASGNGTTAMEVPIKFCKSCNIWRPPRAHHCRICDSCIETQDHHCVWLNNCVGRRNYRYFLTFVASGTVLGLFLLGASLTHILVWMKRNHSDFGHALNVWRVPAAMCVYSFLIVTYPLSLWGYHLFLMGRGETTREYLNSHKFQKKDRHRPFSQHSIIANWSSVFTRPRPPTYMRFRHRYEEGDQRLGERRSRMAKPSEKEGDMEMGEIKSGTASSNAGGYQGQRALTPMNNTPRS